MGRGTLHRFFLIVLAGTLATTTTPTSLSPAAAMCGYTGSEVLPAPLPVVQGTRVAKKPVTSPTLQPSQRAFIKWNPATKIEAVTVQPKFEGNAKDFGMLIPTPSRPKIDEMPRDL